MQLCADVAGVGRFVDNFCAVLSTAAVRGLMTEDQAEAFAIDSVRKGNSTEEAMKPLAAAIARESKAWFAQRGFPIKSRPAKYPRVQVSPYEYGIAVYATGYYLVELQGMRQWADVGTRRAVIDAFSDMRSGFWNCCHAAFLYNALSYYGELMELAESASRRPKVNVDRLWETALETCETEENGLHPEQMHLVGVGGRDDFEFWVQRQIETFRQHRSFLNLRPTGRVDRTRCTAARAWAARASQAAADFKELDPGSFTEPGEFRYFEEQCVVATSRAQLPHVDIYFQRSAEWHDEVAGLEFRPSVETGRGLVEAGILAMASQAILGELEGILK